MPYAPAHLVCVFVLVFAFLRRMLHVALEKKSENVKNQKTLSSSGWAGLGLGWVGLHQKAIRPIAFAA